MTLQINIFKITIDDKTILLLIKLIEIMKTIRLYNSIDIEDNELHKILFLNLKFLKKKK